jgi:uncharacterized lipoprotein YehR (DUF1307 family)
MTSLPLSYELCAESLHIYSLILPKITEMIQIKDFKKDTKDEIVRIWLAIMSMDYHSLWFILDETIDYQDIGKINFIEILALRFSRLKELGDTELYLEIDYCKGCNRNEPVCTFLGNSSGITFSLYFELTADKITDIYHCNWCRDNKLF